jgi:cytochrome c
MDSWEWNKIAGAVLGTLIFVLVVKFAAEAIYRAPPPARPGYVVENADEEIAASPVPSTVAEEPLPDFATELPKADLAAGRVIAVQCQQCHDLTRDGTNKIGPPMWDIFGRPKGTYPGFAFSSAMAATHEPWTYANLFRFLRSPQSAVVSGTKMSYAGLRGVEDRINLIAYLRLQSDKPVPLPKPGGE